MKHFCMAPFVHIQRNSFGEFNPCCMFSDRIYSEHDSIHEAFNSKENNDFRQKMLKDELFRFIMKNIRQKLDGVNIL